MKSLFQKQWGNILERCDSQRVIQWPFKHKGQDINLSFDTVTGDAFLPRVGWLSVAALKALGYVQQSIAKPSGSHRKTSFGDSKAHDGGFYKTQFRQRRNPWKY